MTRNDGKIGVGAALVLGSWIYPMVDASVAAGRYNRKHAFAQPVIGLGPRGSAQVGMRLQLGR